MPNYQRSDALTTSDVKSPDKNHVLLQKQLKSLSLEITNTKQNVVRHILRSRHLERSKMQVMSMQTALRTQVLEQKHPDIRLYQERLIHAKAQDYNRPFDFAILAKIDRMIGWNYPKLLQALVAASNQYDDIEFRLYLRRLPSDLLPISEEMFLKIVEIGSKGSISTSDASRLFHETRQECITDSTVEWTVMQNRLCRRLLRTFMLQTAIPIIHEIEDRIKQSSGFHYDISQTSTTSSPPRKGLGTNVGTSSPQPRPYNSNKLKKIHDHHHNPSLARSSSASIESAASSLRRQLIEQGQQDQERRQHVLDEMSTFVTHHTDLLQSNNKLKSTNAIKQYFKRVAVEKTVTIFSSALSRQVSRFLTRWKRVHRTILLECHMDAIAKHVAALKMMRLLEWKTVRTLSRHVITWQRLTEHDHELLLFASAVEIQRCFRGHIIREALKMIASEKAAESIQAMARVFMARRIAAKLRWKHCRLKMIKRLQHWMRERRGKIILDKKLLAKRRIRCAKRIQRVYRGHLGRLKAKQRYKDVRYKIIILKWHAKQRRLLTRRVILALKQLRRKWGAVVCIQRSIRGGIHRRRVAVLRHRRDAAIAIQGMLRQRKARKLMERQRRWMMARRIQCQYRGYKGRQRATILSAKREIIREQRRCAIKIIAPMALGYITRRRVGPILKAYLAKRQAAAIILQQRLHALLMAKHAKRIAIQIAQQKAIEVEQFTAAANIQRIVRGKIVNYYIRQFNAEVAREREEKRRLSVPYYYRLKQNYYGLQEWMYRKHILRIQAFGRRILARYRFAQLQRQSKVRLIQHFMRGQKQIRAAKKELAELRKFWYFAKVQVVFIQRAARGLIVRAHFRRLNAVKIILWAAREKNVRKMIYAAVLNFRKKKAAEVYYLKCVIRVQAWARCRMARKKYKKSYRSLVRQRALRIRAKREKAALIIECSFRCFRARKRVRNQRVLVADREKERRELKALEDSLEGLHGQWMQELLVIRAQTGMRGHLARMYVPFLLCSIFRSDHYCFSL